MATDMMTEKVEVDIEAIAAAACDTFVQHGAALRCVACGQTVEAHALRVALGALADSGQRWSLVPWTPFERASLGREEMLIAQALADRAGQPIPEQWSNSRYQVAIYRHDGGAVHLSFKTHDRSARHDWRDMQRIKNELCGPEREAIELFPAEARLVDAANQYHLWVMPPGERIPVGFQQRLVSETTLDKSKQRPWDADSRPAHLDDAAEMVAQIKRAAVADHGGR
jgi:hypothetical protein